MFWLTKDQGGDCCEGPLGYELPGSRLVVATVVQLQLRCPQAVSIKSSCQGPCGLQDKTHCGPLTLGEASPANAKSCKQPLLHGTSQINPSKPRLHKHQSQTSSQGHVWSEVTDIKGFSWAASAYRQDAA